MKTLSVPKWKYLSLIAIAIIVIGVITPTASAASPTIDQAIKAILGIKAKTDKLPSDPASQQKIGTTKAVTNWFTQQLDDGQIFSNFVLVGDDFDGRNRSGHISLYSAPSEAPPLINVYCGIRVNDHASFNGIIASSTTGSINTSFSCNSVSLYVQDIADGQNTEESIAINLQYTQTLNLTLGAAE